MKAIQINLADYNVVALTENECIKTDGGSWFSQKVFNLIGKAINGTINWVNSPDREVLNGQD